MTYDASSRKDIRAAEKAVAAAELRRSEVLRQIADSINGREYLWGELERAHIFSTPYSTDANQTYFNLGEQNAGLRLLADIMHYCPEEFILAMREANARRTAEQSNAAESDPGPDSSDESPAS